MTVQKLGRTISRANVQQLIAVYESLVEEISTVDQRGLRLCQTLKRGVISVGPYPKVTIFESANRIMSDLVILYGVKWLLDNDVFPFESYTVEFGNENKNGFDICATANGETFVGEAFNVAPSFFHTKKTSMLKKLRAATANYKVIMFNHDAVMAGYKPKPSGNEFYVCVTIGTDKCSIVPNPRSAKERNPAL